MKLPRNLSGREIVNGLLRVGYESVRQKGDHVYMTTMVNGEQHVAIPLHNPVKVGTLAAILLAVSAHVRVSREELLD